MGLERILPFIILAISIVKSSIFVCLKAIQADLQYGSDPCAQQIFYLDSKFTKCQAKIASNEHYYQISSPLSF